MCCQATRWDRLLADGKARPVHLQGVFPFMGNGLLNPYVLSPDLVYTIPMDCKAALIDFRIGNASDQLIYISIVGNGKVRRYLPVGPQGGSHVELAIKDDIPAGTRVEVHLAASMGVLGTVIIDVGFVEWREEQAP